jgi:hypothetical protein
LPGHAVNDHAATQFAPTTDIVFRLATAIRFTTIRFTTVNNARLADHRTCVASPRANNTARPADHADITPSPPAAIPYTDNRIAAIFDAPITVASASIAVVIAIPAYASASRQHHPACTADVHPFSFSLF